jgi:hypothetical protein
LAVTSIMSESEMGMGSGDGSGSEPGGSHGNTPQQANFALATGWWQALYSEL